MKAVGLGHSRFRLSNRRSSVVRAAPLFLITSFSLLAATRYVDIHSVTPLPPYTSWATAATNIQDAVDAAAGGDEILVTNGVYAAGGRAVAGIMTNRVAVDRPVYLRSASGPQFTIIQGRQVPGTTNGDGAVRCVYLTNGASLSGFTLTNGATRIGESGGGVFCESASASISNCVIAGNAAAGDGGGVYGGSLYACIIVGNIASSSGGGTTWGGGTRSATVYNSMIISNWAGNGGGAAGGELNNCSLVGNSAGAYGGGALYTLSRRCRLVGNAAGASGAGGGQAGGELYDCLVLGNTAFWSGGGVSAVYGVHGTPNAATLYNCTVSENTAGDSGGGANNCLLTDCIVYFNIAPTGSNYGGAFSEGWLNYSCTAPLPPGGVGNTTADPLFVDRAGGNLRLQSNSPCINAGNNASVTNTTDLDGRPRIVGGTVDMGAYEFQPGTSGQFIAWLGQYGLPTDGSADFTDADGDGLNDWQEWRCQTNPTNALSVLKIVSLTRSANDVSIIWQSVAGVNYFLQRATNLAAAAQLMPLATGIPGQAGTTAYTDAPAAGAVQLFYRVGVEN